MIPVLPRPAAFQLIVIRTAMLLGVLLFGVSTWFTAKNGQHPELTPDKAREFGYLFVGLAGIALAGMFWLRARLEKLTDPKQAVMHYMVGYGLGEVVALFGAVIWFVGGARDWFIAGVVMMVVAFQVLPVVKPKV